MRREKRAGKIEIERGSGNVYEDLGFKDPDWLLVKAELVAVIASIISSQGLRQAEAAELLGLTQPKLSNMLRGHFHGFSERRLIDCLTRLGRDVQIVVKEKPRSRASGRLSVVIAFEASRLEDVAGCLRYKGPAKTLEEMDAAVAAEARKRRRK